MFVARPGMKLVVADYSMMELRVAAHYSRDPAMMRAFTEGLDLHALTASGQSGIPYEELLARCAADDDVDAKMKRFIGKTSNFGLLYGMGPKKFRIYLLTEAGVRVTLEEAANLIELFNRTYQGVTDWKAAVVRAAHKRGYVMTIAKRKRRLPNLYSNDRVEVMGAERQGVNAVVQGSCADIINEAIPPIQSAIAPLGAYLLLQCHDELVAESPEEHAPLVSQLMKAYMEGLPNPRLRVPLVAEPHIGDTWSDAKG